MNEAMVGAESFAGLCKVVHARQLYVPSLIAIKKGYIVRRVCARSPPNR